MLDQIKKLELNNLDFLSKMYQSISYFNGGFQACGLCLAKTKEWVLIMCKIQSLFTSMQWFITLRPDSPKMISIPTIIIYKIILHFGPIHLPLMDRPSIKCVRYKTFFSSEFQKTLWCCSTTCVLQFDQV